MSIPLDGLCGRLTTLEIARPDEHGEALSCEIPGNLQADSLIGPGDQGDRLILHGRVLFAGGLRGRDSSPSRSVDAGRLRGDRASRAGVGIGTIYRHFPQRSDLIVGVFRREVDACADAAAALAAEHEPGEALARWIQRYVDFISAKRGLAAALHSGDPAYSALPAYFQERLLPAFQGLLVAAASAGKVRGGIEPYDLLRAVATLCTPGHDVGPDHARRMVDLLIDGLRYGATAP